MSSEVEHPDHYQSDRMEVWDVWDAYDLDRYKASAVKHILRAGRKGDEITDLKKAMEYLKRRIQVLDPTEAFKTSSNASVCVPNLSLSKEDMERILAIMSEKPKKDPKKSKRTYNFHKGPYAKRIEKSRRKK